MSERNKCGHEPLKPSQKEGFGNEYLCSWIGTGITGEPGTEPVPEICTGR
jgi:hypothetical protein